MTIDTTIDLYRSCDGVFYVKSDCEYPLVVGWVGERAVEESTKSRMEYGK